MNIQTGTIKIQGVFPNPDAVLRPGLFAKIRAATDVRKDALLVPQAAVLETQGQYQVAIVGADNKVTMRMVKIGKQVGDLRIIDEGVSPGERVIIEGLQKVSDGTEVSPRLAPPEPEPSESRRRRLRAIPRRTSRPPATRAIAMSKFFIDRPIVAMVIAIFFVITGAVMVLRPAGRAVPGYRAAADPDRPRSTPAPTR